MQWQYTTLAYEWDAKSQTYLWDQRVDERTQLERLNEMGKDGWELCAVETLSSQFQKIHDDIHIYYFKKPMAL